MIKLSKRAFSSNISRQLASWYYQENSCEVRPGPSLATVLSWRRPLRTLNDAAMLGGSLGATGSSPKQVQISCQTERKNTRGLDTLSHSWAFATTLTLRNSQGSRLLHRHQVSRANFSVFLFHILPCTWPFRSTKLLVVSLPHCAILKLIN